MDILHIDPAVLETTAKYIEEYCRTQKSVMEEYLRKIYSLSSEWSDEQTMGTLIEEIKMLKNNVTNIMDEIGTVYPRYFRDKATQANNRPKM